MLGGGGGVYKWDVHMEWDVNIMYMHMMVISN